MLILLIESLKQGWHGTNCIVLGSKFAQKIGKSITDQKKKKNHMKDNIGQIVLPLI